MLSIAAVVEGYRDNAGVCILAQVPAVLKCENWNGEGCVLFLRFKGNVLTASSYSKVS